MPYPAVFPGGSDPKLVCIVGFSGSGKTRLMTALVSELARRGLRVGTIKHDAHSFRMDHPGKDSWRHKQAGAAVSMVSSPGLIGMVAEADHDHHPVELMQMMPQTDIVLAEGFKRAALPKIEVFRPANGKPPACRNDPDLIAVVSDTPLEWGVPWFDPKDGRALADFIARYFHFDHAATERARASGG